jgi:glycosyltransferase involved in cell wall biosynthesis
LEKPYVSEDVNARYQRPNIGIIATNTQLERSGETPLNNLIGLVSPVANKVFVITGEGSYDNSTPGVEIIRIKARQRSTLVSKILEQVFIHARQLRLLFKLRGNIDVLLFFHGTPFPALLLFAQALNIRCFIILVTLGSGADIRALKESGEPRQFGELIRLTLLNVLERVSYFFSDRLIVYGPSTIDQAKLHRYRGKIIVAHRHFLDFDRYRFENNIERRDNVVGYVGRLNARKGILNFVEAIPRILKVRDNVTFLIVGEGHLENEIRANLGRYNLQGKVKLVGWIPHQDLPDYLVSLKLLVIPSYNEGLPNVMLEAMACGTPVLASSVASIPDVVKDKETGFLIQDNSPARLSDAIVATLAYRDLKRIARNARTQVEREFRYDNLTETWKNIICSAKKEDKA